MESAADDRIAVADGVELHIRRWGQEASGRPFLLVHGLSSNARLWDGVAAILAAADHPAVAIDLRSHGESDAPETGYDTTTAADDVAEIAGALGMTGAIFAGQSWGGNVVIQVAARHPGVAAALALVDGGWSDLSTVFPSWEACEKALRPPDIDGRPAAELSGWFRNAHPDWSEAAIAATLANMRVAPDGSVTRRLPIPRHMEIVRSMWDDPPLRYYPDVRVPVLLLPATEFDSDRGDQARQAAASLADATVHEYVGGDHDLHAQQPDRVAADLLTLVDRVR
jgi:pimeloyl-ACP methyl ester carboxylesterase